jgi:heme/copper-type cytochrome/quinol oxidase subunit 4
MDDGKPELEKAHHYWWRFISLFGEQCYKTWRQELFASAIISIATFAITWATNTLAWSTLKTALLATGLTLSAFALMHLVKVPYLLTRPREKPQKIAGYFGVFIILCLVAGAGWVLVMGARHLKPLGLVSKGNHPLPSAKSEQATTGTSSNPSSIPKQEKPKIQPKQTEVPTKSRTTPSIKIGGDVKQGGNGDCQANSIGGNATVENCNTPPPPPKFSSTKVQWSVFPGSEKGGKLTEFRIKTDRSIVGAEIGIVLSGPITNTLEHWNSHLPTIYGSGIQSLSVRFPITENGVPIPNSFSVVIQLPTVFSTDQTLAVNVASEDVVDITRIVQIIR